MFIILHFSLGSFHETHPAIDRPMINQMKSPYFSWLNHHFLMVFHGFSMDFPWIFHGFSPVQSPISFGQNFQALMPKSGSMVRLLARPCGWKWRWLTKPTCCNVRKGQSLVNWAYYPRYEIHGKINKNHPNVPNHQDI